MFSLIFVAGSQHSWFIAIMLDILSSILVSDDVTSPVPSDCTW